MDLQLLSVVGSKMPIHKSTMSQLNLINGNNEIKDQNLDITDSENEIWPISEDMLRTLAIE